MLNDNDEHTLAGRIYWAVYNGFEIRVRERFFWLSCMGVGIGRLDREGLGRGQWVHYWQKRDR